MGEGMKIFKWIDSDNGRFRAWTFGLLCGAAIGMLVALSLFVIPVFEKMPCK